MNARITCPGCQRVLHLPGDCLGQMVQCPACASSFVAETDHGVPVAVSAPEVAPVPTPTAPPVDPAAAIQTRVVPPAPPAPAPVPAPPEDWMAQGVLLLAALPLGLPILALYSFLAEGTSGGMVRAVLMGSLGVGILWFCAQLAFVSTRPARGRFITSLFLSCLGYGMAILMLNFSGDDSATASAIPVNRWVQFRSHEGDFSVLFPGRPTRQTETAGDPLLAPPQVSYQLWYDTGFLFRVTCRPLTASERLMAPAFDPLLNKIADEVVRQTGRDLRSSRSVYKSRYPSKELILDGPPQSRTLDGPPQGRTVVRLYITNGCCYILFIQGYRKGQPTEADLTRFFDSFASLR